MWTNKVWGLVGLAEAFLLAAIMLPPSWAGSSRVLLVAPVAIALFGLGLETHCHNF